METQLLSCPHCGFSRKVSKERIPQTARSVTCPDCRRKFALADAIPPIDEIVSDNSGQSWKYWEGLATSRAEEEACRRQAIPPGGIGALLQAGWRIYRRNWGLYSAIYLYMGLLWALPWVVYWQVKVGGISVSARWQESLLILLLTAGLSSLGLVLGSCTLLQVVINEEMGFVRGLREGIDKFPGYLGTSLWLVFLVIGGGLLLIPGLIFVGLFSLAGFVFLHERERGLDALCISAQYIRTSLWSNLGKVALLLFLLLLGTIFFVAQIVVLPYVLICLYLLYCDARQQVSAQRSLAGPRFKKYFVLPVIGTYLLAFVALTMVTVRQTGFSSPVANLRQMAGSVVIDFWKMSGVAPPGCGLVLEQSAIRPGERVRVRLVPSSEIAQNYYLCVVGDGENSSESYVLDQEVQRQRLVYITAPRKRGTYQLRIYSDYDRTVTISSLNFQVI